MGARSLRSQLCTLALVLTAAGTAAAGVAAGLGVPSVASAVPAAPVRATAAAAPVPATAAEARPALRFLAPRHLPDGLRFGSWQAGPRQAGRAVPAAFCLDGALPADETTHVRYQGAPQVSADQYLSVLSDEARAADLVRGLRARIEGCYREWLDRRIPEYGEAHRRATWQRYGTRTIADGMTTFGVFTLPPGRDAAATHLYAVARDGATVATLHLALPGKRADAPVAEFSVAAAKALRRAR